MSFCCVVDVLCYLSMKTSATPGCTWHPQRKAGKQLEEAVASGKLMLRWVVVSTSCVGVSKERVLRDLR